jgi:hypothetical protein
MGIIEVFAVLCVDGRGHCGGETSTFEDEVTQGINSEGVATQSPRVELWQPWVTIIYHM